MIRAARPDDFERLLGLRRALWPETPDGDHARDLEAFFGGRAREPLEVLVAETAERRLVGFCELSIRAYAEGCQTDRVGYVEGWYVVPDARLQGVGRSLVAAGEGWARGQGCTEMASDAEADNHGSAAAHRALGFADAGLIRCFRKEL